MSRAKIPNGVWTRNVPVNWEKDGVGRTAISKNVLADSRLRECWFVFEGDVTVVILDEELRRVVVGGPEYDGSKWGPFNIDPNQRTVDGRRSYRPDASFGLARSSRGRSI